MRPRLILLPLLLAVLLHPVALVPEPELPSLETRLQAVSGEYQRADHCTSCATATLLRRYQVVLGKPATFSYEDVRMSCNGGLTRDAVARGWVGDRFTCTPREGFQALYTQADSAVYRLQTVTLGELPEDAEGRADYMGQLLQAHPEGVVLYVDYGTGLHAVLLTRLDAETGEWYIYDPCGDGSAPPDEIPGTFRHGENPTCRAEIPFAESYLNNRLDGAGFDAALAGLTAINSGDVCLWTAAGSDAAP